MAEPQRSAFSANLKQLLTAAQANDDEGAKDAAFGLANLAFHNLDRIADALERIAETTERARGPDLHARMGPRP